jgi:hypothetical protein
MRVVESAQILWLGRVRSTDLSSLDSEVSLPKSTTSDEYFIYFSVRTLHRRSQLSRLQAGTSSVIRGLNLVGRWRLGAIVSQILGYVGEERDVRGL